MATLSQAGPLLAPTLIAAGWTNIAEVPAGKVWKVSGWDLVNGNEASADTIKIALNTGDDGHLIMPKTSLGPLDHLPRYREMTVKAGTKFYTNAATGNLVVFTIHGVEITL